jgi:hypothetical protein
MLRIVDEFRAVNWAKISNDLKCDAILSMFLYDNMLT